MATIEDFDGLAGIDAADLRALIDERAIRAVLMRYSRAVDRKDHDLLDSVYWPDATDEHVAYRGDVPGFKAWLREFTAEMATSHVIGNVLIEQTSATEAHVETYVVAFHDMAAEGGGREDLVAGGRYIDRFEKRGREWRIASRIATLDFMMKAPASADWGHELFATLQTRGGAKPDDPLYRFGLAAA